MKNLFSFVRSLSAGQKFLALVEILAIAALPFVLPTQAHAQSGNVYGNTQAQTYAVTEEATVLQVMKKSVQPGYQERAVGAGIGAGLAALVVSQASPKSRQLVGLLALPMAAMAGERIANASWTSEAQEIVLRIKAGNGLYARTVTVVQPAPFDELQAGDAVFVIRSNGATRVVKAM